MKFYIFNSHMNKVWFNNLNDVVKYARKYCRNNGHGYSVMNEQDRYVCHMGKRLSLIHI